MNLERKTVPRLRYMTLPVLCAVCVLDSLAPRLYVLVLPGGRRGRGSSHASISSTPSALPVTLIACGSDIGGTTESSVSER